MFTYQQALQVIIDFAASIDKNDPQFKGKADAVIAIQAGLKKLEPAAPAAIGSDAVAALSEVKPQDTDEAEYQYAIQH